MTHKATLTQSGSSDKLSDTTLAIAIERHCVNEKASFHTPGHKGGTHFACGQNLWAMDVTELPGLDELAYANGVLARIQNRAVEVWGAAASYLSVNGASAGIMAAILACAQRGQSILLPRNLHRSAVNAVVLSGLEPIWYEPDFDETWNTWSGVPVDSFVDSLSQHAGSLAAALVVSPTYAGALSEVQQLAVACHQFNVPLIVDEAHGAHLSKVSGLTPNSVARGADIVVHSLHKTLGAMTQTGMVHVGKSSLVEAHDVQLALNMVQSSSPNYLLMSSIESAIAEVAAGKRVAEAVRLAQMAREELSRIKGIHIYGSELQDPLHILIRAEGLTAQQLSEHLEQGGVYAETVLGNGVLLLLGVGSTANDIHILIDLLSQPDDRGTNADPRLSLGMPTFGDQVLKPTEAFFAKKETVSLADALGRIAAECVAPCPPGSPVLVPGQRITRGALEFCKLPELRVVVESQQGEQ